MSIKKFSMMMLSALSLAALLNGCGSSSKEGSNLGSVARVSETACAQCHATAVSHISGANIYTDYMASAHNLVPNAGANYPEGVGCQGCHGGGSQHNGVGPLPYPNPSAAGKCFECHKNYLSAAHFQNYTANTGIKSAMYASKNFQTDCTACHDPHKADKGIGQEHRDWAASKHGDVNGIAWSNRDFKATADCVRCHTSTGFVNYVQSGFTVPTTTWAQPGDFTREVATCKTCHTSYAFGTRVRSAGQYTAPYTNAPSLYPDAAASNLCLACHTGRVSGDSIKADTDADGKRSFMNSHYLTAGGTVFAKSGFHFYSSASKLGVRDYSLSSSDDHHKIGIAGSTFARTFNEAGSHTNGPCVGCHLTSSDGSHTFSPFSKGTETVGNVALNPMCANSCHSGRGPDGSTDDDANTWFGKDVTAADLVAGVSHATHKGRLIGSLEALKAQLELRGIYFGEGYPYFFTAPYVAGGANTGFTNWQSVATALGSSSASDGMWKSVMGTAFNYNLLVHDPGAVAHNRRYARRLIYDAIDFLDDGIMNRSVNTTLTALPDTKAYKASALAYVGSRP